MNENKLYWYILGNYLRFSLFKLHLTKIIIYKKM